MSFAFIQITDHHICASETSLIKGFSTAYSLKAVLRHIAAQAAGQAAFLVSTGDLVNAPSMAAYRTFGQLLGLQPDAAAAPVPLVAALEGGQRLPLVLLPGNHDDRDLFYQALYPGMPPRPLLNQTFLHDGIQFICVDWGPQVKAVAHPEMLQFLAEALKTGQPSILLMHHACVPVGSRWLDEFVADEVEAFWQIVAGQNVLGIFCGHTHMTYEQNIGGIPVFGLRSTVFQFALQDRPLECLLPPHYRVVTVQDGALTSEVVEVRL